ncbi:MAG: hypothetical protein MRJ93_14800 [Nitrososphaeraceae archaeon]|nr:hypothetical protein [Nitrososphaeraceae archaeon]
MKSITTQIFELMLTVMMSFSIFALRNSNTYAQQNKFTNKLNQLNQTITTLENQVIDVKKTLFDVDSITEDKINDNPSITNAEKRIETTFKISVDDIFQG